MKRFAAHLCALLLTLMLPVAAFAQKEPPHTKETKNAERFIGLSMMQQDPAARRQELAKALPFLQEATQKDPDNARVWLMAGSVYAGLDQFAAADSAFDRALALYPPYAEQVTAEREAAWAGAFLKAVDFINAQQTDQGIAALETAELVYGERPESKYYLGLFYFQRQELDRAEQALEAVIDAVNGPARAKQKPETVAEWDRLALHSKVKLSDVAAARGIEQYNRQQFDSAAASFAAARQLNPHSRDHLFNQLQSVNARAEVLREQSAGKKSAELDNQLGELYGTLVALADTLKSVDPYNEDIYVFSSRAHNDMSKAGAGASKAGHTEALQKITGEYQKLPFLVAEVQIVEADSSATVKGSVFNRLLKPGATGSFTFELIGMDGSVVGSGPVTFTIPAGAANAKDPVQVPFEATIPMSAAMAGWRYK